MRNQNILTSNQFGFRNAKSTKDAVAFLIDNQMDKMDNKWTCLPWPRQSIWHCLCFHTNNENGWGGYSLKIFDSYLSNRTQCVEIVLITIGFISISYGVPQGSILGPTLFIMYINSLCNLCVPNCSISTYADDTTLIIHGSSWCETFSSAQTALGSAMVWLSNNHLTLKINKIMYLTFARNSETFILRDHSCQPIFINLVAIQL